MDMFSKLNKYRSVIEINDFIDFLYSQKIINELNYYTVWNRPERDRLHELFRLLDTQNDLASVFNYLETTYPNTDRENEQERVNRIVSVRGGFPKLPPNYVTRKSLVDEVRHQIVNLQWNKKLVIHGMMGYGKSCLVNDILSDSTVRKYFNNYLFWINLGDCHTKENVLQPMWRLYTAASSVLETKITHCQDVQILKDLLRELFLDTRLNESLIILDDACSEVVLSYFDIGCKCLITTQNKNVLRTEDATFVEVRTGFSKEESLELFKKSLKINWELNGPAEEIHHICQGHPMLIALIGSFLQENADEIRGGNPAIWQYIREMFLRGNYTLNEFNKEEVNIPHIIEKCIEKLLTNNLKELYQDLAIFEQDVNIPARVLEILWNKAHFEVRNVMNKFAEKSLIVPFYHHNLQTNIYGIHEIHLNYLKNITKNKSVHLHRKLIAGYDRITRGNYADLPNDNYSFQFIGYHLFHAEDFGKFNIYFDFKFLENKLRAVGKEDVLRDMQKYEVYITRKDNQLIEKLHKYKDFINRCGGSLYSYEESDIIQYALRENKDSIVFKDAISLAKKSPYLYFQLQKPADELDYSQIINIKEDITAACFVDSPQHILFGTTNGKIKLFYEQSVKEISSFVGHTGAIRHLILSPNKDYFLSVSQDRSVLLFKFAADSTRNSLDLSYETSPRTKQSFWQDIYTPDKGKIPAKKKFIAPDKDDKDFLIAAAFCNNFPYTFRIVTGSERGNVAVWDAHTGQVLFKTGARGHPAQCVMYNERPFMDTVTFTCDDHIYTYELRKDDMVYYQNLYNQVECKSLFSVKEKQLIVVSDKKITIWNDHKRSEVFEIEDKKNNICSTLTSDQQYLVISTDLGTVYIYDIEKKKLLREFENKGLAKSLDTFYDQDKSVHLLLIGSDRKTLQQCHIQPYDTEPQVENIPIFTPYWKKKNAQTALVNSENRIQIFSGYTQISETDVIKSQVRCTCFSLCGSNVIYGLDNGEIYMFHMKNKSTLLIDDENEDPIIYLKCYDPNGSFRTPGINVNGSTDSVEFCDEYIGGIIGATDKTVAIYRAIYNDEKKKISQKVKKANVFCQSNHLIIVDEDCKIFIWNIDTNSYKEMKNGHLTEPVIRLLSCFCSNQSIIGVSYTKNARFFTDIYKFEINKNSVDLCRRFELENEVRSSCFSADGSLFAVGLRTGEIKVWNWNTENNAVKLTVHSDSVQDLLFSPNLEPILVSLGEEIAWWNLTHLHKRQSSKVNGKPSISILTGITADMANMNISFWTDRKPIQNNDYLLSCIKLNGKAKYMSASNDFRSFLTVDDSGKVYIMEVIDPDL